MSELVKRAAEAARVFHMHVAAGSPGAVCWAAEQHLRAALKALDDDTERLRKELEFESSPRT